MELQFKVEVNAPKEIIWSYYAEPAKRHIWEEDLNFLCGVFSDVPKSVMKIKKEVEI